MQKTSIKINNGYEGETIEKKVERITTNREPIKDGAPLIYTERKDGVDPAYDIRTDRFDLAIDALDKVTASAYAKREMAIGERTYDTMTETQKKEFHEKYPNNKYNQTPPGEKTNPATGANTSDSK